ncbi:MAG: hypothetical protein AAF635_15585 [Cyanobacteria bacterium P01_C01_bin.69]
MQQSPPASVTKALCPKASIQALLAPLNRLDRRIQQTVEIAQVLSGTAFDGYLLGGTEIIPAPAAALSAADPLSRVQKVFGLSEFDVGVLILAIAPELDRRYERLYAHLQTDDIRRPTVGLSQDLLCHSDRESEAGRNRFTSDAPLLRYGLIQLKDHACATRRSFKLNPMVMRFLLGQPMTPQLSIHCRLSWPTDTAHVTNSPLLPGLLNRLRSGSVPDALALNFTGSGAKEQGAQAIAATTQQPLLSVNLTQLFKSSGVSKPEVTYRAKQILLQAQLWNAVLYLESDLFSELQRRWLPSAIGQKSLEQTAITTFLSQVANYSGITIFTGKVPSVPIANEGKGIITIPFTQKTADTSYNYWQACLEAAQSTLNETDLFRKKILNTSLEFT